MSKLRSTSKKSVAKGLVLGLGAFEKISAVEGIRLSGEMKRDLAAINRKRMTSVERAGFIKGKYGKKSA